MAKPRKFGTKSTYIPNNRRDKRRGGGFWKMPQANTRITITPKKHDRIPQYGHCSNHTQE
jgi:hypothetical protein